MSNEVIEIGKHSFEIDFKWELLTSTSSSDTKKVLERDLSTCYLVLKSKTKTSSDVLGHKETKASKSKSYSLAAYIFDILKNSYGADSCIYLKKIQQLKRY